MEFKIVYSEIQDTQVDVLHEDVSVHQPSVLSDLLGGSTSMDVDVDDVDAELHPYTRVQQVPLDTDPLMWWNHHVQEFPRLDHMTLIDVMWVKQAPRTQLESKGMTHTHTLTETYTRLPLCH
jgi:hypothetical protein